MDSFNHSYVEILRMIKGLEPANNQEMHSSLLEKYLMGLLNIFACKSDHASKTHQKAMKDLKSDLRKCNTAPLME